MGCCFSSDDDKGSQIGEVNERSRLLGNPVSNTQARSSSHDEHGRHHSLSTQKGDEQSAINRILHKTAAKVIDVSSLGVHPLEQHEYMDRAKLYSQRVATSSIRNYQFSRPMCVLSDVISHEKTLTNLIENNWNFNCQIKVATSGHVQNFKIGNLAERIAQAMQEVKVEHKEDLVVHFEIP